MGAYTDQHVVEQPPWLKFIRIAQVALSLLILALAAFALSAIPFGNTFGTFGFNIFTCLFTFIVGAYLLLTPIKAPKLYNCWAALVLEIFGVIFWLSAFATMASWASLGLLTVGGISGLRARDAKKSKSSSSSSSDDLFGSDSDWLGSHNKEIEARYARYKAGWRCAGAAAGLGGVVWVLFMITLITYSIFLHRHRMNPGNKNLPDNGTPARDGGEAGVPPTSAAEVKGHEMGSVHVGAVGGGEYPRPY